MYLYSSNAYGLVYIPGHYERVCKELDIECIVR